MDGKFEIDAVELSTDGKTFYIQSNEAHPGERQVYALSVEGGTRTRLTTETGFHQGAIAPDNSMFGLVSSSANRPPEVFLMPNRAGAAATRVTTRPSKEWTSFKWIEPQLVTYKARDGAEVYARLYTPEMVGAKRDPKAPAVIFVHGAGYLQNAHKGWSTYYREYMFHHLLASRGYVVFSLDNRGTPRRGARFGGALYGKQGTVEVRDQVAGVEFLRDGARFAKLPAA